MPFFFQVEHNNHLCIGDVILAFGELSLAGASDRAIAAFIEDNNINDDDEDDDDDDGDFQMYQNISRYTNQYSMKKRKKKSQKAGSDGDSDNESADDKGQELIPVIVLRSVAVHFEAIMARIAVARENCTTLLVQGRSSISVV